jgi:hypothetical protein
MDNVSKEKPRYKHDCSNCTFLGRFRKYDLYFCPQTGIPTLLARYSDEGSNYLSGMCFGRTEVSEGDFNRPLAQAYLRAKCSDLI